MSAFCGISLRLRAAVVDCEKSLGQIPTQTKRLSSELLGSYQAGVASNRLVCQDVQGGRRKVRARRDFVTELGVWNRPAAGRFISTKLGRVG